MSELTVVDTDGYEFPMWFAGEKLQSTGLIRFIRRADGFMSAVTSARSQATRRTGLCVRLLGRGCERFSERVSDASQVSHCVDVGPFQR